MTTNLTDLLTEVGLSGKEIKVYLGLLSYGARPISYLAKQLKLNRGTAYVILHSLLQKGLATKSIQKKVIVFSALNPKMLPDYVSQKEQGLKDLKGKMFEAVSQFVSLTHRSSIKPRFMFYDGIDGARIALNDTLQSKDRILKAFLSIADITEAVGDKFFNKYTDERVKKGYSLHAIRTLEKDKTAMARNSAARRFLTNKKERRIVKYIADEFAFPISLYIYDNRVLIISSKEEGFAAIVESSELAKMQRHLFDLLWVTAARS